MQSNCPQEMVVISNDGNLGILKTCQYLGSAEKGGDSKKKQETPKDLGKCTEI